MELVLKYLTLLDAIQGDLFLGQRAKKEKLAFGCSYVIGKAYSQISNTNIPRRSFYYTDIIGFN